MNRIILVTAALCFCLTFQSHAQGKWLKKMKDKVEQKGERAVDDLLNGKKKGDNPSGNGGNSGNGNGNGNSSGSGTNGNLGRGTAGSRNNTPPPANESIDQAQTSLSASDYSDTRYYIQQALWGLEYELGKQVLADMPGSVNNLSAQKDDDVISSSGFGFTGLNIQRTYGEGKTWIRASLVNGSPVYANYAAILNNPGMYNSSESNYKNIRINNYKAVLEYTSKGYNIIIPFGQSSAFALETSNLSSEDDAISAAEKFDIDSFKKILGEQ